MIQIPRAQCRADDRRLESIVESARRTQGMRPRETVPDFELETVDGATFSLATALGENERVLLVFLRHLA